MSTLPNSNLDSITAATEVLARGDEDDQAAAPGGIADSTPTPAVESGDAQHSDAPHSDAPHKDAYFREILAQSGSAELRQVDVEVQDGRIVLCGRVSSFYQKQLAQESLLPVAIGMQICNQIEVDH
ncbi:BON domain-containing protein [Rhodopirellula sp. JC639]|uniref:BON domain-containing protein n=1 Tax=Stieleria mannarensis TaxID=2755585 RepID=UPI0016024CA6|nr:BON domain-containing protein [Rhodopirellula sp. JC639]